MMVNSYADRVLLLVLFHSTSITHTRAQEAERCLDVREVQQMTLKLWEQSVEDPDSRALLLFLLG